MLSSSTYKRVGRSLVGIRSSNNSSLNGSSSCSSLQINSIQQNRQFLLSSRSSYSSSTSSLNRRNAILSINSKLGQQSNYYTTERVLQLRLGNKTKDSSKPAALPPTLYDASRETENCGVGLVASLKSVPSRKVVEQADEMLVRMSHRGGCGCDPASGDGAGMCFFSLFFHINIRKLVCRCHFFLCSLPFNV